MSTPVSVRVPPGWYQDPQHVEGLRWWDGEQWSSQTRARSDASAERVRGGPFVWLLSALAVVAVLAAVCVAWIPPMYLGGGLAPDPWYGLVCLAVVLALLGVAAGLVLLVKRRTGRTAGLVIGLGVVGVLGGLAILVVSGFRGGPFLIEPLMQMRHDRVSARAEQMATDAGFEALVLRDRDYNDQVFWPIRGMSDPDGLELAYGGGVGLVQRASDGPMSVEELQALVVPETRIYNGELYGPDEVLDVDPVQHPYDTIADNAVSEVITIDGAPAVVTSKPSGSGYSVLVMQIGDADVMLHGPVPRDSLIARAQTLGPID